MRPSRFISGEADERHERQSTLRTQAPRKEESRCHHRSYTNFCFRPSPHKPTAPSSGGCVRTAGDVLGRRVSRDQSTMYATTNHDVRSSSDSLYTISRLDSRQSSRYYTQDRVYRVLRTADGVVR